VIKLPGEWLRRLPANQGSIISITGSPTALRGIRAWPNTFVRVCWGGRETQLPPSLGLQFELSERHSALPALWAAGRRKDNPSAWHAMGIQLMLDELSAPAYSSLSYCQLFPFDFVKIDRPFVNTFGLPSRANTGLMAADGADGPGSLNLDRPIA